jgi:hypothetical protein
VTQPKGYNLQLLRQCASRAPVQVAHQGKWAFAPVRQFAGSFNRQLTTGAFPAFWQLEHKKQLAQCLGCTR